MPADEHQAAASAQLDSSRRRERALALEAEASSYHQARVLILVTTFAGKNGKFRGLTKLAKLDFLLRYPVFMQRIFENTGRRNLLTIEVLPTKHERVAVESRMVRYKYGPWDDRYYGIVGGLVGRGLLQFVPDDSGIMVLASTTGGQALAESLKREPDWRVTAQRCEVLKLAYNRASGNTIKSEIYKHLPEVVDRPYRTVI